MKLQIESIDIEAVKIDSKTSVSNHILHLNLQELRDLLLKDPRISSAEINVVSPGDQIRVVNVVDIIQPRCKVEQEDSDFPGWFGKLTIAGRGKTKSLRNLAVVLSNSSSKRAYSSVLDMFGIGSELSRYGKMNVLSIHPFPAEQTRERDFENAVKLAGLKTAVYLARASEGHSIDETEVFDLDLPSLKDSQLPKVAYYHMLHTPQHDYQGIGDPILYGAAVTDMLPTIIHPNEILDGGLVNTHTLRSMETYALQNHAIIKELYRRHKKELIFVGIVAGVASVEPVPRQRMAMMVANLMSNVLGADCAILNKVHGGMPHVDLGHTGEECEKVGVKTTLFIDVYQTSGSLSDNVLFGSDRLDAIVNAGNMQERIRLSRADKIIGGDLESTIYHPELNQKAGDEIIEVEGMLLAGLHSHTGEAKIVASQY